MRRGLLAWDRDEVSANVLEARVDRLQNAMREQSVDSVLIYNNFPRPAAVSWLTHFVPYWSQGVLVVPADGPPEYFVSLSKRVAGWIEETSHMGDIVSTPRLGADLSARLADVDRIGIVERDRFPGGVAVPLLECLGGKSLEDATELFRSVRHPADDAEISLSRRAATLAKTCLDDALPAETWTHTGPLTAAIEGPARLAGAEEVLIELAPDLSEDKALRRLDGNFDLGDRYALRVSLAYKGHWVRIGRTVDEHQVIVSDWIDANLPAALTGNGGDGLGVEGMQFEACIGSAPLSGVAEIPTGAVGVANLTVSVEGKPHLISLPVLNVGGQVSALI